MTTKQLSKILTTELGLIESKTQNYKNITSTSSHTKTGTYITAGFSGGDFYIVRAEKNIFEIYFNDVDFMNKIQNEIKEVLIEYGTVHVGCYGITLFAR